MKQFSCGDVVPGCEAVFRATSEALILEAVAEHARKDHGLTALPSELLVKVKSLIRASA